jgi:hypothetical protein
MAGIQPLNTKAWTLPAKSDGSTSLPMEIAALLEECSKIVNRMLPCLLL